MSFAAVKLTPLRASRALQLSRPAAELHTSPIRAGLNESDRDRPQLGEHIELNKKESVTKREWKPELASNSEQVVRHEKHSMTFEEMQAEGVKISEEMQAEGVIISEEMLSEGVKTSEEGKEPKKSNKVTGV